MTEQREENAQKGRRKYRKMTLEQLLDNTIVNWRKTSWGDIDFDEMTDKEQELIKKQILKVKSTLTQKGATGVYFK